MMRRFVLFGATLLALIGFGLSPSMGRAAEQIAQQDSAAAEKQQGGATGSAKQDDDPKKQEQEAIQKEFEEFGKPFFKELKEKLDLAQEGKEVDFAPLVKQFSERLATKSTAGEVEVALNVAQYLEMFSSADNVKPIYEGIGKLADRIQFNHPEQARQIREALKGPLARISLVGTKPVIEGATVGGEKFDWSKYKGKVVLLDFWATWCGPCLRELPNVKKAYEKYHAKGFEVVGISLDDDPKVLAEFLEKEKLPWTTLFPTGEARGFDLPLAKNFQIDGIPATFLIDRDGKLVSVSARGPRLESQLEKMLEKK